LLVIGLGGGTTVTVAAEGWDGEVTVLEVEPEVARALASDAGRRAFPREHERLFGTGGARPTLVFEDARAYLARETQRWDGIVCQPSEPWLPWSAPLFTADFYRRVRDRLSPGGVAIHWVQLYEIGVREFAAIVRAFRDAFPDARLYHPPGTGEVVLVGGGTPRGPGRAPPPRADAIAAAWERVGRGPFPAPLVGPDALGRWLALEGGGRQGNLRSRLEFRLPLLGDRGVDRSGAILRSLREAAERP